MGPKQTYYVRIDEVFHEWYSTRFPDKPVLTKMVVPVLSSLQGHPEEPRQAYKRIQALPEK